MSHTVAAVIPTYNGKALLLPCFAAIIGQTHPVRAIYVVDNASSDGTREAFMSSGLIERLPAELDEAGRGTDGVLAHDLDGAAIDVFYVRMEQNGGSMGGFAEGMARVIKGEYDWTWLMDNDSVPADTCLERLLEHADEGELLGPAGLVPGSTETLSFPLWDGVRSREIPTLSEAVAAEAEGAIEQTVCPFHGCLLVSSAVTRVIGPIRGEMFHWGGEVEYAYHARKKGFRSLTVLDAVNYHPRYKVDRVSTLRDRHILAPAGRLHSYCFYRNNAFILWRYKNRSLIVARLADYIWYFLVKRRFDVCSLALFLRATGAGIFGRWGGERRYLDALSR